MPKTLQKLLPVSCPRCGEAQNTMPVGFDPDKVPFQNVSCMACGRVFSQKEYLIGLEQAHIRRTIGFHVEDIRPGRP